MVATQKHSSASINTNKAKTTTKSITVVDTWYYSNNKVSYIIIFAPSDSPRGSTLAANVETTQSNLHNEKVQCHVQS